MRKLALRLVLFLCERFDLSIVDETRIPNGTEAKARAERWEAFAREEGGLFDMIDNQRTRAFEAFAELRPDQMAEKEYLAAQERCWRQVRTQVDNVIMTGKIARANEDREASVVELRKSV